MKIILKFTDIFQNVGVSVCCSLLLVSLFPAVVSAEDLLDIVESAKTNDPVYQAARHKYLSDSETYRQARSRLMPTISAQYEDKQTDQHILRADNNVFASGRTKFGTTSQGVSLEQPLFDWEIWTRFRQSKATVSRVEAEYQLAEQELLLRASETYFALLEREDQLATVVDEKNALDRHLKVAERRRDAGLGRSVDVGSAEARYLEAVAKEIEVESRLRDSRYAIVEIIGEVPGELSSLSDALVYQTAQPADPELWVERALESNLEIISGEYALQESEEEINARRSGHYPNVSLVYTYGNEDTAGSLFGGGSELDTSEVILRFNMPLFQGFYVSSRLNQAREDRYGVMDELHRLERKVEREARDAYHRIDASIAQINALQRSVSAQERILNLKESGYEAGTYNILEVLDAQRDLSNARHSATKARFNYVLNTLRLKFSAGNLSDDDISAVNNWLVRSR